MAEDIAALVAQADLPNGPGIYCFINSVNAKRYVGQAVNLRLRRHTHLCQLRKGVNHCTRLQAAFTKYGEAAFSFHIIERCEVQQLNEREQFWLDHFPHSYNVHRFALSALGVKRSAAVRARNSAAHLGKSIPLQQRTKISASLKGIKRSPETRLRMSKPKSMQTRAKMSAWQFGRQLTIEHRAKISNSVKKSAAFRAYLERRWRG